MKFYSPLAFMFLSTIPIIILLYLLKQRHQEHTVSSLYLWNEVFKDIEANAPWQKLKKNILMVLQMIAVLLLTLALSRPFLNALGGRPDNVVLIMDATFSMQATDVTPSRFEAARKQALTLVSNLQPGTLVTLISIGNSAVIEENLSGDRNSVNRKLKDLKVTNYASNPDDVSTLVQSMVKQHPNAEVILFGDENIHIPGVEVQFKEFSGSGENYAVTLLSYKKLENGITVLSRISNFSLREADIPVSLYADDRVLDAKNVHVNPGETANVYWNSVPSGTTLLECRIDREDALAGDNVAYDVVNALKTSKAVLVSQKNLFIEKAISLMNGIELFKTDPQSIEELKGYDLYVFDGYLPDRLPSDGSIMVFNPPPNAFFKVNSELEFPSLVKPRHDLFKYIESLSFSISRTKDLEVPVWGEPVLQSGEGTVIFAGSMENRRLLVFGFDLHNSDIVLTPAFPILMSNSLEWLIPSRIKNIDAVFPGQSIEFNLDPKAEKARVITPSGETVAVAPPFPARVFDRTGEIGPYILEQQISGVKSHHHFSVNAPSAQESNLLSGTLRTSDGSGVPSGSGAKASIGKNLQSLFLWLALLILLVEWWVYSHDV